MPSVTLAVLPNDDASFRAVCMLLAQHPMYADVPFKKAVDLFDAVRLRQAFAAVEDNRLTGIVLWKELSDAVAKEAIVIRQMPPRNACQDHGEALVATAFLAQSLDLGRAMWEAFLQAHCGRIILYERHRPGNNVPGLFKWVDKSGRVMGQNL